MSGWARVFLLNVSDYLHAKGFPDLVNVIQFFPGEEFHILGEMFQVPVVVLRGITRLIIYVYLFVLGFPSEMPVGSGLFEDRIFKPETFDDPVGGKVEDGVEHL